MLEEDSLDDFRPDHIVLIDKAFAAIEKEMRDAVQANDVSFRTGGLVLSIQSEMTKLPGLVGASEAELCNADGFLENSLTKIIMSSILLASERDLNIANSFHVLMAIMQNLGDKVQKERE